MMNEMELDKDPVALVQRTTYIPRLLPMGHSGPLTAEVDKNRLPCCPFEPLDL